MVGRDFFVRLCVSLNGSRTPPQGVFYRIYSVSGRLAYDTGICIMYLYVLFCLSRVTLTERVVDSEFSVYCFRRLSSCSKMTPPAHGGIRKGKSNLELISPFNARMCFRLFGMIWGWILTACSLSISDIDYM